MNRRTKRDLDDKLARLADLLNLTVIVGGEQKPGLYLSFDGGRYRVRSNVEKTVEGKNYPVWIGTGILTDDYKSVTQLHDVIDAAIRVIVDFSLVKKVG